MLRKKLFAEFLGTAVLVATVVGSGIMATNLSPDLGIDLLINTVATVFVLYGGALLAAWDLFLDPLMVGAGRWKWEVTGSHVPFTPDIPLSNAFGWLLAGLVIVGLLNIALPRERRKGCR